MPPSIRDLESVSDTNAEKTTGLHLIESTAIPGHAATDSKGHALVFIDSVAEAKLRRKVDWHIIPIVALMYLFCFIDRANIGNARIAGMERDLGLAGTDYNVILSVFYASYIAFELPSNFLCKLLGPGRYLPVMTTLFGLCSMCTAFTRTKADMIAVRFVLGMTEAGMLPGIAYYLSRWYRKDELVFRLALYIVCAPLAGAFGGLLASGILTVGSIGSVRGWKMIFLVEGIITMGIGGLAYLFLTDNPGSARWLSEKEKALCETRIKSENVGSLAVLDKIKKGVVLQGLFSFNTIINALIFLLTNIIAGSLAFFLPTIVRTLFPRRTTVQLQLLSVPPYLFGAVCTLAVPYGAYKTNKRAVWMLLSALPIVVGFAIFLGSSSVPAKYAATFIIASGGFSWGSLCNAWASANVTSDAARSAAIGMVVFLGNCGGLVSTWAFVAKDAPTYIPGNAMSCGAGALAFILTAILWAFQARQNRLKESGAHDHRLKGKTLEEIEALGIRHPGFRYVS